jgi:glycosyltransferase involved in cell wall biosynthesis
MKEIYLHMPVADCYGWGLCGKYMLRELSKKTDVKYVEGKYQLKDLRLKETDEMVEKHKTDVNHDVDNPMLCAIRNDWDTYIAFKGNPTIGYVFIEGRLSDEGKKHLESFDKVIAGSQWNAEILKADGINAASIPQGVDRDIFKASSFMNDKFTVFSGGKWEYRKGQDLVIKAVAKAQKTYPDIRLAATWHNLWYDPATEIARHINESGLQNLMLLPLQSNDNMPNVMHQTDIGIFPNRIEGGTNLVMMEYLACGKPVIANNATGQKDVLDNSYAFYATEPEKIAEHIIYAYENRDKMREMGKKADKAMDEFSWTKMADRFLEICNGTLN